MKIVGVPSPWSEEISTWLQSNAIQDPGATLLYKADADQNSTPALNPLSTVILAENLDPADVVREILGSGCQHVMQKKEKHWASDLKTAIFCLKDQAVYFQSPAHLILDEILRQDEFLYRSPEDKAMLKEKISASVAPLQSLIVSEAVEAIVEELYMNSIIDAPREAQKKKQKNNSYDQGLMAKMTISYASDRMLISCEDPFGSLDVRKFVGRMNEVYQRGAGQVINLKEGAGAGLGCIILFENCESLFLGVKPGEKTLVSCLVPLGMSHRKRAQVRKSLHLI